MYHQTVVTSMSLALQLLTVETLLIPQMGGWISQGKQWVPLQHIDASVDLDCRDSQGERVKITVNGLEEHQLVNVS